MKKISVIVAVYNSEKYLEHCVKSILNQTYADIEILLINDGSTDDSSKICHSIASNHSNVIVIDKENGGCYSAWNTGLKIATGQLIGFVDNDDYILPTMYEELANALEKTNSDIACCGRYRNIDYKNEFFNMNISNSPLIAFSGVDAAKHLFVDTTLIKPAVWDKLYRHELFDGEEFPNTFFEDAGLTYKLLLKSKRVVVSRKQLYAYSVRYGSMITSPWNSKKTNSYSDVTNEAICYIEKNYPTLKPYVLYWQIQFSIEAWERCRMSDLASDQDYQIISKNVNQSYAKLDIGKLKLPFKKKVKKEVEFWLFRYCPNVLCKIKKKELK